MFLNWNGCCGEIIKRTFQGEATFHGDKLKYSNEKNGKHYREERVYISDYFHVKYFFVSRIYDTYMEEIFQDLLNEGPDIVVFNSCLWDITRYGPESVAEFESRAERLFKYLDMILSPTCLFFWLSSLPVNTNSHKAYMMPRLLYKGHSMRIDLLQANYFIHMLCYDYQRDFLDLSFHCRDLTLFHQMSDGLHWDGFANRQFSSYIMRYIADSLGIKMDSRANLIEYHAPAVIEIDSSFEQQYPQGHSPGFRPPCTSWKQANTLSPESSSDWGRIKYDSNREWNPYSGYSQEPQPENFDNPVANYSSRYIQSLMSGVPDLPVQYLSKSQQNYSPNAPPNHPLQTQEMSSPNEYNPDLNFMLKSRTPISYGDLFQPDGKTKTKKKRKSKTEKQNELLEAALNGPNASTDSVGISKPLLTSVKPMASEVPVPQPPSAPPPKPPPPPVPRIQGVPPPPIRSFGAGKPFECRKQAPFVRPQVALAQNPPLPIPSFANCPSAVVAPPIPQPGPFRFSISGKTKKVLEKPVEKIFSDASSYEESEDEEAMRRPSKVKTKREPPKHRKEKSRKDHKHRRSRSSDIEDGEDFGHPQLSSKPSTSSFRSNNSGSDRGSAKKTSRNLYFSKFI